MIRVLAAAGANPDQEIASSGLKPLHEAAAHNHHLVVQALLEAGVDPLTPKTKDDSAFSCGSRTSTMGHTPLMYACHNGHVKSVEVFLSFLEDINTIHQALVWASEMGKSDVVARILQHPGVDPNTKVLGDTPLFRACAYPDLGTVQVLLDAGADPRLGSECRRDGFGWFDSNDSQNKPQTYNCLHRLCGLGVNVHSNPRKALESDLCEILRLLVENGVDVHERTPRGQTALHGAVRSVGMTRALIETGADANAVDSLGNTPLYNVKSSEVLQILVEHGHANIEIVNSKGQTPLHFMLSFFANEPSGIESIIKFITYGPDCNIPDGDGNTPLHIVVQPAYPKAPLIEALLHGGADPSLKNARGASPLLSIRLSPESMPAINMLLDAGADINAADSNGETLLFGGLANFSFEKKDEDRCIKALIERGANIAVRDLAGRTILHATIGAHAFLQDDTKSTYGCKKLDFLVSLGLDLQAVDSLGNTLLHELAERARATSSLDHGHSMVDCWRKLAANGLNVDQKNHAGRTALHILSATDVNWLTTEPGRPAPIDFVIPKTQEIDSPDEDGITPLHLAAAGSVSNTAKLLEAGADPTLATHEGLTALHLACRARQSNTVGLLLRALQSKLGQSVPNPSSSSTAGVNAKAKDFDYITPLFYACRSGQPETVALLVEAGADVNEHALKGCAGFEDENALWQRHNRPLNGTSLFGASPFTVKKTQTPTNIFSNVSRAVTSPSKVAYVNPVKLEDIARPADKAPSFGSGTDMGTAVTARLEEILDILLSKSAALLPFLQGFIDEAARDQKAYTARCFSDALKRYRDGTELEDVAETANSDDSGVYKAETRLLEGAKPGESNQELFKELIHQRQYQAVNELARRKADFLAIPEGTVDCNFSVLVKNGFSSLIKTVGDIETTSRLVGGQWHAFGDKTRSGLWSEGNNEITTAGAAFLVQAVSRQLPNMAVVQLLVETFYVDINEFEYQRQRVNNESIVVPASSALHQVAHGHTWWQTFQALPYLLKAGANIEIRNFKGETPLLSALEEISTRPGLFQKHVVRTLLEWGADVNAVDNVGNSCLSYANKDINLLKALMEQGATPSTRAVFAAIEQLKVDALEAFLKAGFDPNTKRIDQPPRGLGSGLFGKRTEPQGSTEDLPIYYACLKLKDFPGPPDSDKYKRMTEIVQMLLKYGADPFAKFLVKATTPYSNHGNENKTEPFHRGTASPSVPEGYEERTVLHELMRHGEPPNILLGIKALEINRQDGQGRTLLHLACQNHPDQIATADQEEGDQLTRFQKLVSLGATLEARDNFGRNILHYLIDRDVYIEIPKLTLGHILDKCPHLVLQSDKTGHTPLHNAVRLAAFRRHPDTAETLLSAGADALAVTKSGDNMLHLLATNLDTPELRNLFHDLARRGVDINARNPNGETPLFAFSKRIKKMLGGLFGGGSGGLFAPQRQYSEDGALQLFQNLGADFSARNVKGQGLLHVAAPGDVGRFKELLSLGLDPMLEDDAHQTPIDVAAACGNQDVLALFEKRN
jgi:ankyrin repeat protein